MSLDESDWKHLKRLHPMARDRFCERVLTEVANIQKAVALNSHEKYVQLYQLLRDRDRVLGRIFNDLKRSNAQLMLTQLRQEGLVTPEELDEFSNETREQLTSLVRGAGLSDDREHVDP